MYIVELHNGNFKTEIHGLKDKLKSGNVAKGINCIDSFSFSVLPNNPGFNIIFDFQTLVNVWNTNKNRYDFQGRVLCSAPAMDGSGKITKEVTCESFFGYLCDSVQKYVEERNWTVRELLQYMIDCHNSQVEEYKRFVVGEVSEDLDTNDNLYLGIQRENTWKAIEEKLLKKIGGEIRFRVVDGVLYLDYLKKIGETRTTKIELSRNMKAIRKESDPSAYITRLIPLGAKLTKEVTNESGETETVETEERLTIEDVNDGKDYIDDTIAIEAYGIHAGYLEFEDVHSAQILLTKARNWLAENNKVQVKYAITALDLSLLGLDIDDFNVHDYHPIVNPLLGIDDVARIIKKNIDICDEINSTIEVGDNFKTLTEIQQEQIGKLEGLLNNVTKLEGTTNNLKDKVSDVAGKVNRIEGIDGVYFYVKYSQYADGHVMTSTPDESTLYMGTCSSNEATAPTDYTKYTWVKIKGNDGTDGTKGESQYFHVKYSNDGKTFTGNLVPVEFFGWASGIYTDHATSGGAWICTVDKIPVTPSTRYVIPARMKSDSVFYMSQYGTEDDSSFISFTFGADEDEDGLAYITTDPNVKFIRVNYCLISNNEVTFDTYRELFESGEIVPSMYLDDNSQGEELGAYMGTLVDFVEEDSTNFNDYTWRKIVGEDGRPGIDGVDGKDGNSSYFFVKFSANANGNPMTETPQSNTKYMGVCSTTSPTAPTSYTAYKWTQCRGNDGTNGTPGQPGEDGRTQYLHIKYSDDGRTFTANNGEELGAYIGTLVDFNQADSMNFNDYTWKKFTEDVDEELDEIRQTVEERYTSAINTSAAIILSALESYVQTSRYEEFRQTVETQFSVMAREIAMSFSTTTQQITNVDGELQSKFTELYKYIKFSGETAITIGSGNSAITLEIDNTKGIVFKKNGVQFGLWDGENFYTGNIIIGVNERAQFGAFAFVPRTDGSLSFLKVGG